MLIPYIRQSRKKERTISIEEQRYLITRWANAAGVELGDEIVEQGVSGSKSWRERELGRAVAACERGRAAGIVVAYQDRLSRENGLATAEVWDALDKAGARLVCAAEGLDTANGDQELTFAIKAAIARDQWKRHKANWASAQRRAIERGVHLSAFVPAGYVRGTDGVLEPDPELASVIRDLFSMRAKRASWSECAAHLLAHDVQNHSGSAHWSHRSIARLIKNRVYLGEAFHGDFVKRDAHPAIVTPSLWRAAQSEGAEARIRQAPDDAFLAGVLRCAGCGRPLKYERGRDRYRCRRGVNAGPPCGAPATVKASVIEPLVEQAFLMKIPLYLLPADQTDVDLRPLEQEATAAKAAYEAWLAADISDIDPTAFREGTALRKQRLEAAEDALREASVEASQAAEQLMLIQKWDNLSVTEKRRWLKQFDVSVLVRRGKESPLERCLLRWKIEPSDKTLVAGLAGPDEKPKKRVARAPRPRPRFAKELAEYKAKRARGN